jgi:hypothetical protein
MDLFWVDRQRGVAFPLAFAMCLNKDCEGFLTLVDHEPGRPLIIVYGGEVNLAVNAIA